MNLFNQFKSLSIPQYENSFTGLSIKNIPSAKIAISTEGYPVLLISTQKTNTEFRRKNVRLKYLEMSHNIECRVTENETSNQDNFTVIIFKSNIDHLQIYFLGIAEVFLATFVLKPTEQEVYAAIKNLIEIFRAFSEPPTKTIQGLWAELFVINNSEQPEKLLNYWHQFPEEKFDFNADLEKLEVKSNSKLERVHLFSSEQLNPPNDAQVVIGSLFTRQSSDGSTLNDIVELISKKVNNDELKAKMYNIVSNTLGNSFDSALNVKFDYSLAKQSLKFYMHQEISKIEKESIPSKISDVRYKSDLTNLETIDPKKISKNGLLFNYI